MGSGAVVPRGTSRPGRKLTAGKGAALTSLSHRTRPDTTLTSLRILQLNKLRSSPAV